MGDLFVSEDNIRQNAKAVKNMMAQGCAGCVFANICQVQINTYGSQILDFITVFLFTKIRFLGDNLDIFRR